ncbi:hypothetical protein BE61_83370 [Bradyrhizobium elkanii USDA 61]|nr:hypothetical protein BE61_83370 [Bradyrhizobium elkanii USDA 61]
MAGAGVRATAANPNMRLVAIPAAVTDLIETMFVRCMVILLIAGETKDGAPLRAGSNI